ncbi:integral membrane sensor signal transduction histidine kinase [Natronolimnohabitans innermongolicus JCM 12255]|uniref:Integral membrane sensor signal transduction histidine kinase n=1 Tax=Natronolimnohabitans innermongolicus JCM 12255 TaxID=1227499 RepID=L9X7Q8_9EURY|nr:integral membrane sensor signal transduction histidine kinase [Natronolimnohabitans innermongolicus JCM 12255]
MVDQRSISVRKRSRDRRSRFAARGRRCGVHRAWHRRIVERHGVRASEASSCSADSLSESAGGEISVDSEAEAGTMFSVTLPAVEDD